MGNKMKASGEMRCHAPCGCHAWPPLLLWHVADLPGASGLLCLPYFPPCSSMRVLASPSPQWTFHRLGPSLGRGSVSPTCRSALHTHPRWLGVERQPGAEAPLGCLDWPPCTASVLITVSCSHTQPFADVTQASCALLPAAWHCHSLHTYCVPGDRGGLHVNCLTQSLPQLCQVHPILQMKPKLKEFRTSLQVTYLITGPPGALIQSFLLPQPSRPTVPPPPCLHLPRLHLPLHASLTVPIPGGCGVSH